MQIIRYRSYKVSFLKIWFEMTRENADDLLNNTETVNGLHKLEIPHISIARI